MILVQKSYRKNILRDLRGNLSRFLSLFGIVALGVMILTGLASFAPSMRIAGQKYYVQQNVFDLRVLSTLGLSEDDIDAIAATEGVTAARCCWQAGCPKLPTNASCMSWATGKRSPSAPR